GRYVVAFTHMAEQIAPLAGRTLLAVLGSLITVDEPTAQMSGTSEALGRPGRVASLPTGTVTFLFTDIEGSTQRWETHREAMPAAVRRHDELLRGVIETSGATAFKTIGDAFGA